MPEQSFTNNNNSDDDVFESPKLFSPTSPELPTGKSPLLTTTVGQPPLYQNVNGVKRDYEALIGNILGPDALPEQQRDTLDEGIQETLKRDCESIVAKLTTVLSAGQIDAEVENGGLREWDMWGPLFFSLLLSLSAKVKLQSSYLFELSFLLIWIGASIVFLNAKLLGHRASLMHTLCFLGYSVFPLSIAALLSIIMPFYIINVMIIICALVWSIAGTILLFYSSVDQVHDRPEFGGQKTSYLVSNTTVLCVHRLALHYKLK